MGFLTGKYILIMGVANSSSIAYGIAKAMHYHGAKLAFTYKNKRLKNKVQFLANQLHSEIVLPCDVSNDHKIQKMFEDLKKYWPNFDGLVHSIGYAPKTELSDDYVDNISRSGFKISHDITSYSFVALAKACRHMLNDNATLITLSFLGSQRTISNYNIMGIAKASLEANVRYMANSMGPTKGIRVNAISTGPIKTLAAYGIKNFKKMFSYIKSHSPLRRTISLEEIGNVASFLCSDLASGITGQVIYVDGGFNIVLPLEY
ncbi:MAG: SDR family oxidoreductase [Candidatus Dasytiphilus stammeri]